MSLSFIKNNTRLEIPQVISIFCICFIEPDDPRKVIVKKLVLVVADRPEVSLDLTGDISKLKKETFVIKEGISYKIRIEFIVQREIVHGLKYVQKTYKLGLPGNFH